MFPIGFSVNCSVNALQLQMTVIASTSLQNKTEGLLGNYDGDPSNDCFDRYTRRQVSCSEEINIFYITGPSCKYNYLLISK